MNKASATNSPELGKTERMLLIAKNYWDYTTQPIVFVAPTLLMAADIQNRFFRLIESCVDAPENLCRVRGLSLCKPDGLKSLMGRSLLNTRNAVFFFDHTCLERSDSLVATGKLANAIWENRLGEVVTAGDDGWGIGRNAAAFAFKIPSSGLGLISPEAVKGFERATSGGLVDLPRRPWTTETEGGATVPCPWEREGGRETFFAINDPSKHWADVAARQVNHQLELDGRFAPDTQNTTKEKELKKPLADLRPRHAVDKLRTADILQAMIMRNATDWAIPEEWMDELSDLVWRERDRLGANTEN